MAYTALYREWRPRTLKEVVGQDHITRTLQNALAHDRVAHAYLFAGPRGTGKTSVAKILAKAVNCPHGSGGQPCCSCSICESIASGTSMDVIEIDAASNRGIGEIRDLREKIRYSPIECTKKVYIIDEVHMLTAEAFNALLKTLEEPPSHALFILATTDPRKVPPTILSRCQRFDFHRLSRTEIAGRLEDVTSSMGIDIAQDALHTIARRAEGSLRDALSLLDQCAVYSESSITREDVLSVLGRSGRGTVYQVIQAISSNDAASAVAQIDLLSRQGVDLSQFIEDLREHLRDLLLLSSVRDPGSAVDLSDDDLRLYREQALEFGKAKILEALDLLGRASSDLRYSGRAQLWLEIFAIRLVGERNIEEPRDSLEATASDYEPPMSKTKETAPVPAKAITLEGVAKVWPEIMAHARKTHAPLHAWLLEAKPVAIEGHNLVLCFRMAFHKGKMEKEGNAQLFEQVLRAVLGHSLGVVCRMSGETEREQPSPPDTRAPIDLISEVFGGEVVNMRDLKEGGR